MRIITFYTDKEYSLAADRLITSGKKFGYAIKAKFFRISKWPQAIQYKTQYIYDSYKEHQPLLYLDADCEILAPLTFLEEKANECDIAIRHRNLEDRYNAGVILFGTNKNKLFPLIKKWKQLTFKDGLNYVTVDQKPFQTIIDATPDLNVYDLPCYYNYLEYDKISGLTPIESAVIFHHKMSKTNEKAREWKKFKQGLKEKN